VGVLAVARERIQDRKYVSLEDETIRTFLEQDFPIRNIIKICNENYGAAAPPATYDWELLSTLDNGFGWWGASICLKFTRVPERGYRLIVQLTLEQNTTIIAQAQLMPLFHNYTRDTDMPASQVPNLENDPYQPVICKIIPAGIVVPSPSELWVMAVDGKNLGPDHQVYFGISSDKPVQRLNLERSGDIIYCAIPNPQSIPDLQQIRPGAFVCDIVVRDLQTGEPICQTCQFTYYLQTSASSTWPEG